MSGKGTRKKEKNKQKKLKTEKKKVKKQNLCEFVSTKTRLDIFSLEKSELYFSIDHSRGPERRIVVNKLLVTREVLYMYCTRGDAAAYSYIIL